MKYIKTYEYLTTDSYKPQVGDYVICKDISGGSKLNYFLKNNIGQIVEIYPNKSIPTIIQHRVKYDFIPGRLLKYFEDAPFPLAPGTRSFTNTEILYFSHDKEILKILPITNKYNL